MSLLSEEIERKRDELVEMIREYSRGQKELWQLVPNLALEADGRTGYGFQRVYGQGVLALQSTIFSGSYTVYVDLATGDLVSPITFHDQGELDLALDTNVLRVLARLDELDAQKFVDHLRARSQEPHSSHSHHNEQETREWRRKIREEQGLQDIFTAEQRGVPASLGMVD